MEVPEGTYWVSVHRRYGLRRLHVVGGCYRRPAQHVKDFEILGGQRPHSSLYHECCQVCFPTGHLPDEIASSSEESSSDQV
eukprot:3329511-Amphidinium_carterae.1